MVRQVRSRSCSHGYRGAPSALVAEMNDDLAARGAEMEAFFAELRRVCPESESGLAISGSKGPPRLSQAELTALLRTLPDRAGTEAFVAAWYAAGPPEEPVELSAEEEALRRAYAEQLDRICPPDKWNEPPYGWCLPHGLEHAVAVMRGLPDGAGAQALVDALDAHRGKDRPAE
jgi:hypothetical protein